MKQIKLGGKISLGQFAIIDDCDFELVSKYKWFAIKNKTENTYYARTMKKVLINGIHSKKCITIHRLILNLDKSEIVVDHKNGNGLDNTRENLRTCTHAENACNKRKVNPKATSRYKGVSFSRNKWLSQIMKNRKTIHLGRFNNEIDAAIAYNESAKNIHGEFANINII